MRNRSANQSEYTEITQDGLTLAAKGRLEIPLSRASARGNTGYRGWHQPRDDQNVLLPGSASRPSLTPKAKSGGTANPAHYSFLGSPPQRLGTRVSRGRRRQWCRRPQCAGMPLQRYLPPPKYEVDDGKAVQRLQDAPVEASGVPVHEECRHHAFTIYLEWSFLVASSGSRRKESC